MEVYRVQKNSFLIRIWREQDQACWQGWIQHIRTGESSYIQSLAQLQDFFECYSGKLDHLPHKGLK